jgi:tetratricopeptide (TPR) repeat protein
MGEGSDGGRDSRPPREVAAANDPERGDNRRNHRPADTSSPGEQAGSATPANGPAAQNGVVADEHDTYSLYQRGLQLLERGSAAAAAQLLERASAAEPQSRSVLEALARAQFDAGRYAAAAANFRRIVEASPADDYAQFGLGLALARTGDPAAAAEHLALAAAMQPNVRHYTDALRSVRATLNARSRLREESSD